MWLSVCVILYSLWVFSFWHRLCRKWGWFLALLSMVITKREERLGGLLRQWVAGGWGRCVRLLLLLGSSATADRLVGDGRSRCTRQGCPCCRLSKKNAWIEKKNRKTETFKVRFKRISVNNKFNLHLKKSHKRIVKHFVKKTLISKSYITRSCVCFEYRANSQEEINQTYHKGWKQGES